MATFIGLIMNSKCQQTLTFFYNYWAVQLDPFLDSLFVLGKQL